MHGADGRCGRLMRERAMLRAEWSGVPMGTYGYLRRSVGLTTEHWHFEQNKARPGSLAGKTGIATHLAPGASLAGAFRGKLSRCASLWRMHPISNLAAT